jgi:peptide/nickel transport system substrate-binding protein
MKRKSRVSIPILFLSIGGSILFSGCKRIPENDKNSILVTSLKSEPNTLHPVCGFPSGGRLLVFDYTQKTLTRTDLRTLDQIPLLVKSLAQISPDGKEFTYELRNDVKWDDGSPLTVDDVIFTMKVTKCPLTNDPGVRPVYDNILDIVKDPADPQKFRMIAKEVYFLNKYLFDELYLVEKKHWDPTGVLDKISIADLDAKNAQGQSSFDGNKYPGLAEWMNKFNEGTNGHDLKKLTGLGPYEVTDWKKGTSLTLTRKNNWWGEKDTSAYSRAYPAQIVIKIIPDDQARYLALKNQSLDVDFWLFTNSFEKLKGNKDFNDHYYSGITDQFSYNVITINTRPDGIEHARLFEDRNVRRAVALLTPVDELNNTMMKGMGTRQASFIQPIFKNYYNDTLKLLHYDLERAKKLLHDAGWQDTDGDNVLDKMIDGKKVRFEFRFTYNSTDPANRDVALMIKDAMYKAGVKLIPDPVDQGEIIKRQAKHNFDMALTGLSGGSVPDDPAQFLDSKSWPNGDNWTGFGNAETDALIDQTNKVTDESQRIAAMKKLQEKVYEEQPFIYLYSVKRKIVISKKFSNPGMYIERPGVMLNNLKLK